MTLKALIDRFKTFKLLPSKSNLRTIEERNIANKAWEWGCGSRSVIPPKKRSRNGEMTDWAERGVGAALWRSRLGSMTMTRVIWLLGAAHF